MRTRPLLSILVPAIAATVATVAAGCGRMSPVPAAHAGEGGPAVAGPPSSSAATTTDPWSPSAPVPVPELLYERFESFGVAVESD